MTNNIEPWRLVILPDWLQEVEEKCYQQALGKLKRSEQADLFAEHAADMVVKIRQLMAEVNSLRDDIFWSSK